MGQEKQFVLKEVVEAQRYGIVFDCAHGRNHFSFTMIEKALDQGFLPDTISTDLTFTSATRGPVWDLTTTMSKLLHFGMSLDDLVRRATSAPAKIMGYEGTVGTLRPGANADIALLELRDHFLAGRFDIAMGGVTVTPARAEKAFFSIPTFVDGKRPLARREYRDRFTNFAAIDQPGVRVIANPGSANEAFVRAHFRQATVIIHHDNASVFDELVPGRADVMITDALEADHQPQLHPHLSPVPVAAPFTRLEKAYMFARDPGTKSYIDGSLATALC